MAWEIDDLAALAVSSTRIDLTWTNPRGFNHIEIWREKDGGGYGSEYLTWIWGHHESWEDHDCVPESQYCYKFVGVYLPGAPSGKTDYSNEACATALKAVEDPTDIVATPISDIEIDVTFKDTSSDETGHRLERKLGVGGWDFVVELEPNREFFRDGGLFLLESGYTDCVETDVGKQVKDDGGEIGLLIAYDNERRRWVVNSGNTIANASAMTITGGTGAGTAARATTGLVKGSSYTYRVRASAVVSSDYIESAQVTTISEPAAPTLAVILSADIKDKSIRIRWSDVAVETGYRIEMSKTGDLPFDADEADLIAVVGVGVTDFLAEGLDVNTAYSFRVRAYNAAGNGTFSATKAATTDAVYVPTEFERWIRTPKIKPVYLAEIYTKMTLTSFTLESGVVWKKTISTDDRGIDILEVFEDSDAYVERTSIATVQATASTFWFDYDNRILYIHTSDDSDPSNFFIEGAFWLYFSTHKDVEFIANGRLNYFLPLLSKEDMPSLSQEIKSYFEGNFAISSGAISFKNDELTSKKFFDKRFETYTWLSSKFILKAGREDFTYDLTEDNKQFKEVFTAYVDGKSCDDKKFTLQLLGIQKRMEGNILLNKFTIAAYPGMIDEDGTEDRLIGKPIPIGFGLNELTVPIAVDIGNGKFKFNDSSISVRSKSVDEVRRNRAVLIEDVHYYVDLQRGVITFSRDGAFIIEAGVNDKIDFKEGGGEELNITLDPGTYTTAELCAEIKAKMEAANSLTFTVTSGTVPDPRTITIAADGNFSLLWKTGTNGADGTDQHVGSTIGFYDDEDDDSEDSYEADEDVITPTRHDIMEVFFTGFVNSADEVIENGAEIFKHLLNNYKEVEDSGLNLDSIYEAKYANENELSIYISKEIPFNGIVRMIEHSIKAYAFQDEFGRLGIRPQQTALASNAKYVVSGHTFSHLQKKSRDSLFWKVIVYYNKNRQTDDWESKEATDNEVYWKYKPIKEELKIHTYFRNPAYAQSLATSILNLLNKAIVSNEVPMLLFGVMAGDLIVFSRTRFFSTSGTANEITLRIIKITKTPGSGKTTITAEVV